MLKNFKNMTNYEILKQYEAEKEVAKNEVDEVTWSDIESEMDCHVMQISTGKFGYAESYLDSTDVCFTVPSEDLTEYRVSQKTFNNDFVILPINDSQYIENMSEHDYILSDDGSAVGIIRGEDNEGEWDCGVEGCTGTTYVVDWLDNESSTYVCGKGIKWLNDQLAIIL